MKNKTKTIRHEISERNQQAHDKRLQQQRQRRANGEEGGDSMSAAEVARSIDALDTANARDAGLTLAEWRALSECERVNAWENSEDSKFAADQGLTLADYRRRERSRREREKEIPNITAAFLNGYAMNLRPSAPWKSPLNIYHYSAHSKPPPGPLRRKLPKRSRRALGGAGLPKEQSRKPAHSCTKRLIGSGYAKFSTKRATSQRGWS